MNNPEYIVVENTKYKINTDFKVALKCNKIIMDNKIGENEKMLSIIYLLFGEEALNDKKHRVKLIELGLEYLSCGIENENTNEEVDMDFEQDYNFIKASFMSDYNIDLNTYNLHWWDFYNLINGLKEDCVLNRIRSVRRINLNDIKDKKEKEQIKKQKERFKLKNKEQILTKEQQKNVNTFYELTGIKRKE